MKTFVKTAVAGALALGATHAFALGVPSTNSSDLVLVVENTTTTATYALDTGISLNTLMAGTLVSGAQLSTALAGVNQTIAASSTFQSFLASNPASSDAWTLIGGQYNGTPSNSITKVPGAAKLAYTSTVSNGQGTKVLLNFNNILGGINTDISAGGGLSSLQTATESTTASVSAGLPTKYGQIASDTLELLGNTDTLYAFTGNGTTGQVQSYIMGTATLGTNGTLSIVGNSSGTPTPLPAAVWLFGSGLMGLVGISRRRKAAV